jgi:glycine/sarcosine N-methyltransferase
MLEKFMDKKTFYNSLSADYDSIIDFDNSIINRTKLLSKFISTNDEVLDFGCGSGVDSISCRKLGAVVTAFDISELMISKATKNAAKSGVQIKFITTHSDIFTEMKFDKIISLGNTFANINSEEIKRIATQFSKTLQPNGQIILQLVNYESMPQTGEHILHEKNTDNAIIKRYYKFNESSSEFFISITNKSSGKKDIINTEIFRYDQKFFGTLFTSLNMKVEFYGSLNRSEYNTESSKDLIVIATTK